MLHIGTQNWSNFKPTFLYRLHDIAKSLGFSLFLLPCIFLLCDIAFVLFLNTTLQDLAKAVRLQSLFT